MGQDSPPAAIGRYTILSVIGRGAMGVVYHARDPLIGRELAIKTITLSEHLPPAEKEEFKQRFFREAQAAGALRHPNIVTIYDMGEQDGVPFIAMEFLEGTSLAQRLKEGPAPGPEEAVDIARQVAEGLSYAHGQGIIHRDIKPDNILIASGGRAVIADFGVAHMNASDLTRTGEILGTPFYMCPEQVLGGPPDCRSDLFSLGVVFYQMLAGKRPFRGESISAVCYQIVHGSPEPPSPDAPIPAELVPILDKLLAKKPEDRYKDAGAFIAPPRSIRAGQEPGSGFWPSREHCSPQPPSPEVRRSFFTCQNSPPGPLPQGVQQRRRAFPGTCPPPPQGPRPGLLRFPKRPIRHSRPSPLPPRRRRHHRPAPQNTKAGQKKNPGSATMKRLPQGRFPLR
ncbi:MAG: serine/threonine-protein kinase [Acidobacteriota bacterium]